MLCTKAKKGSNRFRLVIGKCSVLFLPPPPSLQSEIIKKKLKNIPNQYIPKKIQVS